jgi:hypothetical protein
MSVNPIDHIEREYSYLLSQYKQSTNLIGTLNAFLSVNQGIEDQLQKLFDTFNVDIATNDQLDFLGLLYALERFYIPEDTDYFQFDVTPLDMGYRFADTRNIPYRLLTDDEYKRVLKCWAITLNSKGSTNDIIEALFLLFNLSSRNQISIAETNVNVTVTILDTSPLTKVDINIYNYKLPNGNRLFPKLCGIEHKLIYTLVEIEN